MSSINNTRQSLQLFTRTKFFIASFFISAFLMQAQDNKTGNKEIIHSVYITSNTGIRSNAANAEILNKIVEASKKEDSASLVIIGNIVPKSGFPNKDDGRKKVEEDLQKNILKNIEGFKGKVIFTPGENEWKIDAPDNIDDLESFLQDNSKAKFWPNDGCPIDGEDLNDKVHLITVDSQWYLENWDDHPDINKKCDYKTREEFFIEFKDELKDNQGKTILVAVHHPIMSATKRGFIDRIVGAGTQSFQNPDYKDFRGRLETLSSQFNDVIFISGHEKNLQFIEDDGVPQIISGVTQKPKKARPDKKDGHFAGYENGYAKLKIFKDGSSNLEFFKVTETGSEEIYNTQLKRERTRLSDVSWRSKDEFGKTFEASIYTEEETDKDPLYERLWGDHYRSIYSKKIEFPVLFLDTLPGNLKPIAEGGGHQSRSLRFIDDDEHEYTLRALRKSAIRFLQSNVIQNHYVEDYLENTVAERYVQDFYTTAHPYAPYAVNGLMDALGINHATPKVYYVPKQEALGIYNENYGDELYMLEEHVGDENKDLGIFGKPNDIISTKDLFLKMRKSKDVYVDEDLYIRARLLDMLIGDWDRHSDQWRWAEYKEADGKKRYEPIPRDRDQAFPKFDGPIISFLKLGFPPFRAMEDYDAMVDDPKWFNVAAYPLDNTLIKVSRWEDWEEQVKYIQENISDEVILNSFKEIPEGTEDASIEEIKKELIARRANLGKIAKEYFDYLKEFEVLLGSNEDNKFEITRKPNGITEVKIFTKDKLVFDNSYSKDLTKEIWIYGLDGDDEFIVDGKGNDLIKLKILGGEENDIYDFRNTRKAKLYDYKSKKNTIKTPGANKWLVDSYDINTYSPSKKKDHTNVIFPSAAFNSDTGFKLGLRDTYTTYGLANNPFSTQHSVAANYFFLTQGFDLEYTAEFAHIFYNWNFRLNAYYSSPNFTMNYFGSGNETEYDRDDVDKDYNRVKMEQWSFAPSLIWRNDPKSSFYIKPMIESFAVSDENEVFIGEFFPPSNDVFDKQLYAGLELNYNYFNKNNPGFPSQGMELDLLAGYKTNIDDHNNEFAYVSPLLSIDYPLHSSGIAAIATKIGGEAIIGDNYEFYHGATLGGNDRNSLRGYRNQRFNGKYAFYHNTDLRVGITKFRTNFIPIRLGVSAGFDYGRVWMDEDNSDKWHNNVGGSIFINGFNSFTGNFGYYVGDEGGRLNFTIGFNF